MSKPKKITALMLAVIFALLQCNFIINAAASADANLSNLSDIKGHYAEKQITDWINKGFILGFPDGTFRPEAEVTRAQFVTLLNRAFKLTGTDKLNKTFSDVTKDKWFYNDVIIVTSNGILEGYPDGTFGAEKPISRQDAGVIIGRYLSLANISYTNKYQNIADKSEISDYAVENIKTLAESDIITLKSGNKLNPKANITRADAVVWLYNAYNLTEEDTESEAGPLSPETGDEKEDDETPIFNPASIAGVAIGDATPKNPRRTIKETKSITWDFYGDYDRFLVTRSEKGIVTYVYANYGYEEKSECRKLKDKNDGGRIYAVDTGSSPKASAAVTEQIIFELTNTFRAENGREAFKWNKLLAASARAHSEDMYERKYLRHTNLDGVTFSKRISNAGYRWRYCAENIARGYLTAFTAVNAWINSAGHRRNMLSNTYTEIGVGWCNTYTTQDFGKPRS